MRRYEEKIKHDLFSIYKIAKGKKIPNHKEIVKKPKEISIYEEEKEKITYFKIFLS